MSTAVTFARMVPPNIVKAAAEGQMLGRCPVDVFARLDGLATLPDDPLKLAMDMMKYIEKKTTLPFSLASAIFFYFWKFKVFFPFSGLGPGSFFILAFCAAVVDTVSFSLDLPLLRWVMPMA